MKAQSFSLDVKKGILTIFQQEISIKIGLRWLSKTKPGGGVYVGGVRYIMWLSHKILLIDEF